MQYQAKVIFHDKTTLEMHVQGTDEDQAKRRVRNMLENKGLPQAKKIKLTITE